ncbi:MAG: zinc ribbon domain-containing protein [Erysipelotrichaceae bacterium]
MKKCPKCHKNLPNDSIFCTYCGGEINKILIEQKNQLIEEKVERNPKKNSWGKLAILLFLFGVVICDLIIATILANLNIDAKPVFIVSLFCYICAIICGFLSFVVDSKDKKQGYQPNGNSNLAMVSIAMSIFVALLNITNVF